MSRLRKCDDCEAWYSDYTVCLFGHEYVLFGVKLCEACFFEQARYDASRLKEVLHNPRIARGGFMFTVEKDGFLE